MPVGRLPPLVLPSPESGMQDPSFAQSLESTTPYIYIFMDMHALNVGRYLHPTCEYNVLLLVAAICLALIQ